jgi:hypothetical protein
MIEVKKPSQGRMTRVVPGFVVATIACFALIGAGVAQAGAVLSNGTVELGVNDAGQLNFNDRGVYFVATGNDGTRAGCPCEGWGAGNEDADPSKRFSGFANQSQGISGVEQESFESTATTAISTTNVGGGRLQVTHEFEPFIGSENLFEVKVTLTNVSAETLGDVRYTRLMDWDIEPTPFEEFVTVRRGTTPALLFSNDNGFESNDPLRGWEPTPMQGGTQNVDFTDSGPADHGALFDFGFGALEPDQSITFSIFYGAAATTAEADAAISASGAELYSYGKPNAGGAPDNTTNTFIFGFRGLGGKPLIPPKLTLTPKLVARDMGTEHTVTLLVTDFALNPVPGAPVVFGVTGANPQADSPATTDESGVATFSYTGTTAGRDTIRACLDGDGDGACSSTEITARARVDYEDPIQPKTLIDSGPADEAFIADGTPTFEFSASAPGSTYECRVDTAEFAPCTSPVTLDLSDGEHTFEVRATDLDANTDASAETRTFTVDTTPPQTTIDSGPLDGASISSSAPVFEFSSDEPGSTFVCVIDGGEPFSCDSPYPMTELADAEYTFTVTAVDAVGNSDPTPETRTFTVDTTAPQTTIDSGPLEGAVITDSTPAFEFSSDEPGSTFECSIDGGAFPCDSPYEPSELADGQHTFDVRAADAAGNTDGSPPSRTFTIDTTSQTTIDSGPSNGAHTTDTTPTFAFSSGEDGSTFACSIDAGTAFACESALTTDALDDGEHMFAVTATDVLGNVDPTPASRTFTVDTVAPETTIDSGPADGATTADSTPAFEFSSSETGSTFACRVDAAEFAPCTSGSSTAALSDGEHSFDVRAIDAAGNTDGSAAGRTFTVDATAPQTTIDSGAANGATTVDSTPAFAFSSSEAGSTFACSIDGGEPFACASQFTPDALDDGEHTFTVTATDAVGNDDGSAASRTFTVDTTAPQTTIDSGHLDGTTTPFDTATFEFSSGEAGSTYACSIDAGEPFACESPFETDALADGEHTFAVSATDAVGNTDGSPASRTFTVDTTGPQTTFVGGPAEGEGTSDTTPTFEFSSSEVASTFECSIDGDAAFACESPFTLSELADGEHTFAVTATDGLNNSEGAPVVRTFTVDTAAPQTAVGAGPAEGTTTADNTPAFAFSSDAPGSTFECSIDGGAAFDCASPYTPAALADGEHTFTVTATDSSGNRDASPTTRRFTVNTAPAPVVVPVAPPAPKPAAVTPPAAPAALLPCVSRRKFSITLRPAKVRLVSAVVRVNHKRVAVRKRDGRLRATVDLRGLPKRTYAVTIDARDARRHHYKETRRYRVC